MIFTTDPAYASYILEPDPLQQAEDTQLYRHILHKLLHIGTDLANILHGQAIAHAHAAMQHPTPPKPSMDPATAFDRIARAIRRTITLARSLNEPLAPAPDHTARHSADPRSPALREAGQQDAAGHPGPDTPGQDDTLKAAGHPDATPAGTPGRGSAADADAPSADLRDRPEAPDRDAPDRDAPDRDDDDTGRPPAAVIAEICRDLGLDTPPGAQPWTRCTPTDRNPADIEPLCTRAAAPSSAATSTRQPGPRPQAPWPQGPAHNATQHSPDPQPDERDPGEPAATPRAQPSPIHPGTTPPDDPAPAIATTLHHPTHIQERWRPPPNG